MNVTQYFQDVDNFLDSYKLKIEGEKKEIAECQKKVSNLVNTFSQVAPTKSVIESLYKDEEPEGFVFSKYEEKRKQLAEQRRAEYNAYLEKKEAERSSKVRFNHMENNISPKSILDSVNYEKVLAKRKEEEAKFRNLNIADILYNFEPVETKKPDSNISNNSDVSPRTRCNGVLVPTANSSKNALASNHVDTKFPESGQKKNMITLDEESIKILEERIEKQLLENKLRMLLPFENEFQKNTTMKKEIENLKSSSSVMSLPQRIEKTEDALSVGRTGGGGEPVRDSNGNLLTMRGHGGKGSGDSYNILMAFPSMLQQQKETIKDKMTVYREELQKQIDEKRRIEELKRAKTREQEERIEKMVEEQRLKQSAEIENERKKKNKIDEEFRRQEERRRNLEEFQRKDAEARRKKSPEVKTSSSATRFQPVMQERSTSPPIPAVRTKVLLEKAVEAVPAVVKPEKTFSTLAEIRRKIMEEQQKSNILPKKSYEVMNRRTVQDISDDDDDDDILKTSTNSYRQYSA